jgi:hypothetical protein
MATPAKKPTPKATVKATPKAKTKVTPKATPKPTASKTKAQLSPMDELIKLGVKNLSPAQKARLAKLLGIQYTPPAPLPPKGTYNPKDWEGVVGDKGW